MPDDRVLIEATTIGDLLLGASLDSDGDAVVFPDERASYPELEARAEEVARGLRALGVGPGDKVAILMPNCVDYAVSLYGIARLGAVSVPLNGRFKALELGYVVGHSDAKVLLTADRGPAQAETFALLEQVRPEAPALQAVVDLGHGSREDVLARAAFVEAAATVPQREVELLGRRVRVRDAGVLMYTSGTTAQPKGCLITHEAVVRQAQLAARRALQLRPGEAFWDPLPMFHTGGVMPLLAAAAARGVFCHPGHFEPGTALEMIERERCVCLYVMFDTIWVPMQEHPRFADTDLSAVRTIYLVGPPERMRGFQERIPWVKVATAFGMTEVCAHLTLAGPDADEETRLTTAGPVQPELEAKVVDPETGAEQPTGEVGEVLLRGPCLFDGYYKQPEASAEAVDAEGWFHSGDLGLLDERGRFTFKGRLKDMLKVGGENVSPLEVEGYLAQHEAVAIVQVVAAPDARYAEVPAAFVELRPGASATEEELIDYCLGNIATFKVPRYVRFVDEWPMSGTKIQKFALRERIAQELAADGITEAPRLERPLRSG
jgi:fatty-acyl-CoA synthase